MKIWIIAVVTVSVLLGVFYWIFSPKITEYLNERNKKDEKITLTWWGLFDEEGVVRPLIEDYQKSHPKVTIKYVRQNELNYRTRVQTQIRANQGPNLFTLHSSWVPEFIYDLVPAPNSIIALADFEKNYFPIAKETLTYQNNILALPLEIDGLVMYYNEEMLKAANVKVPESWQDFLDSSRKMTVKNQNGQIQSAGAAMGTTANIDFWQDIVSLLFFQQPNANLISPATKDGADVIKFYTSFVIDPVNKTWDINLPSALDMFATGKLAFYFGSSNQANKIIALNPELKFKTAPVPQLPGKEANFGAFWALGVANKPNSLEAWEFAKYLTSPQSAQVIYQQQTQNQAVGRVFARRDMAELLRADPILGAFVKEAPTMKGWYLQSQARDNGLIDEINSLYQQAIDQVLGGADALTALTDISSKITEAINKYTTPQTPAVKK